MGQSHSRAAVDGAGLNYKICLALNSFGDLSRQCSPHSGETGIYLAAYNRAVNKPSAKFSQSLQMVKTQCYTGISK